MDDNHPITPQKAIEPLHVVYRKLEQLEKETEEQIKIQQESLGQIQNGLSLLQPFLRECETLPETNQNYLKKLDSTGSILSHESAYVKIGVTAGILASSVTSNVSGLAFESHVINLGNFNVTIDVLERLSIPLRSNLSSMVEAVSTLVPSLGSLALSIEDALRQTTHDRRNEAAAHKFRDLLSELGKQLAPESEVKELDLDWIERDQNNNNLTQASRCKFAIYRHLNEVVYPNDIRDKCGRLAKLLRDDYNNLNPIAHNRNENPKGDDEVTKIFNSAALHIQELIALKEAAWHARESMVEKELRRFITVFPSPITTVAFFSPITGIIFQITPNSKRSEEIDVLFKLTNIDKPELKIKVRIHLVGVVRVEFPEFHQAPGSLLSPPS